MGNKKGFTLIEVMTIIAILGILAAIAIPQHKAYQDRKNGVFENVDYSEKDAEQIIKKRTRKFRFEKHCIDGYVFIVNWDYRESFVQLIDSKGNGVLCEDVK